MYAVKVFLILSVAQSLVWCKPIENNDRPRHSWGYDKHTSRFSGEPEIEWPKWFQQFDKNGADTSDQDKDDTTAMNERQADSNLDEPNVEAESDNPNDNRKKPQESTTDAIPDQALNLLAQMFSAAMEHQLKLEKQNPEAFWKYQREQAQQAQQAEQNQRPGWTNGHSNQDHQSEYGTDYGYPYTHQGSHSDPMFGSHDYPQQYPSDDSFYDPSPNDMYDGTQQNPVQQFPNEPTKQEASQTSKYMADRVLVEQPNETKLETTLSHQASDLEDHVPKIENQPTNLKNQSNKSLNEPLNQAAEQPLNPTSVETSNQSSVEHHLKSDKTQSVTLQNPEITSQHKLDTPSADDSTTYSNEPSKEHISQSTNTQPPTQSAYAEPDKANYSDTNGKADYSILLKNAEFQQWLDNYINNQAKQSFDGQALDATNSNPSDEPSGVDINQLMQNPDFQQWLQQTIDNKQQQNQQPNGAQSNNEPSSSWNNELIFSRIAIGFAVVFIVFSAFKLQACIRRVTRKDIKMAKMPVLIK